MKTLYLVRHAKSDWANADVLKDIDRPLNKRGVRNAYEMAARLKNQNILPQAIISSNGIRALHTAVIFAHQIGFNSKNIVINPAFYHAPAEDIFSEIQKLDLKAESLMVFSHNPGLSDFASFLNKTAYLQMPTCAILTVHINIDDWKEFDYDKATVVSYDYPKKK